ncbi:P-loop containing nucleoside triphosphate hydrolase protein [Coprinopsis sp. MPI-PUGE-AT-0042]|nr:P-loop containing nucleoside triphosphate hydrolase protein [Coprinopsis sp. MPI-PUGE-AT-0042]
MAPVLHANSFKSRLSAIYLDEAHTPHESHLWRDAYSRFHLLRRICGLQDVPLVALSATLPTIYRNSLSTYVGLKADYHLINLGNSRPELSVIIKNMEFDITSFRDVEFLFNNSTLNPQSIPPTIIYIDNIERLTSLFWWCRTQLEHRQLPLYWVDIIHAGLSERHRETSTERFRLGITRIWLGTDLIGAGMDFPHVKMVVQYCCRDLSLVGWEQRRGRAGRSKGSTGIGLLLVEKSMADDGKLSVSAPGCEDPGLLEVIRPRQCYFVAADTLLENPNTSSPCVTRCSFCNPSLLSLVRTFTWVPVTYSSTASQPMGIISPPNEAQRALGVQQLKEWRRKTWEDEWKDTWTFYGPRDLVEDSDIELIVKNIHQTRNTNDIYERTQISHFDELAPGLLVAVQELQTLFFGHVVPHVPPVPVNTQRAEHGSTYSAIEWAQNETPASSLNTRTQAQQSAPHTSKL